MRMLNPHPTASLEYWFFKVNSGQTALLVDWICRRNIPSGEIRISVHSPTGREVFFLPHHGLLQDGPMDLAMDATAWAVGEVHWDLALTPAPTRIRPQIFPAEQLGVFDLSLVSAPDVAFDGWIAHRGNRYFVSKARGMMSHYWGRQLPADWWWVSANQFDTDLSLEFTLLHTHLYGSSLQVPLGYLYLRQGTTSRLLIAPPTSLHVSGSPEAFELTARPLRGAPLVVKAAGRDYAPLGEDISNTLVGDLEVSQDGRILGTALRTAGLERRRASS